MGELEFGTSKIASSERLPSTSPSSASCSSAAPLTSASSRGSGRRRPSTTSSGTREGGSGEARGRRVRRSAHSCVLVFDGVRPTQAERNGWVGRKAVTLDGGFFPVKKKIRF